MPVDLSRPYQAVVPTLDGPVLMTLARLNGPVTGRQVHQLSGTGSEAGVRNVLNRLVGQGIVRVNGAGSALLYHANRAHLAWPAVAHLAALRGELIKRLSEEAVAWSPRARSGALFGSAARGDGAADSDIDIVVVRQRRVGADNESWQNQVSRLRVNVEAWTGNRCQIYELSSDDLGRHIAREEAIVAQWRRESQTFAGADFRRLLSSLVDRSVG